MAMAPLPDDGMCREGNRHVMKIRPCKIETGKLKLPSCGLSQGQVMHGKTGDNDIPLSSFIIYPLFNNSPSSIIHPMGVKLGKGQNQ